MHHSDQCRPGLFAVAYLILKREAHAFSSLPRGQPQLESEPVDGRHPRFTRFDAGKQSGQQQTKRRLPSSFTSGSGSIWLMLRHLDMLQASERESDVEGRPRLIGPSRGFVFGQADMVPEFGVLEGLTANVRHVNGAAAILG